MNLKFIITVNWSALVLILHSSIAFSQNTIDYSTYTINDCINTPCQDIVVEGIDEQLSFVYIDCNCSLNSVFIPKGKARVIKALSGTINVAQGTLIKTGLQTEPVTNTFFYEALDELISNNVGEINNTIQGQNGAVCIGDQPLKIIGNEGEFYEFEITYAWFKSTNNQDFELIEDSNEKDYTPPLLNETTYYKRQMFSSISTGTFSNVFSIEVIDCYSSNCEINLITDNLPTSYTEQSYTLTETIPLSSFETAIGRLFGGNDCNIDLNDHLRLSHHIEGLPEGLFSEWSYPKIINENSYWELSINGTPTTGSSGTYTISLTVDNSFIGNNVVAARNETTSITTSFTIAINPKPILPTPVNPIFLSSLLKNQKINDNVGQTFIGKFKSSNSSSSLQEGIKYYELKHEPENEN